MGTITYKGKRYDFPGESNKVRLKRAAMKQYKEDLRVRNKRKARERRSRKTGSVKRIQDIPGLEGGINKATRDDELANERIQTRKRILETDPEAARIDRIVQEEEQRKEIIVGSSAEQVLSQREQIIQSRRKQVIRDQTIQGTTVPQEQRIREQRIETINQSLKAQVAAGELTAKEAQELANENISRQEAQFQESQRQRNERENLQAQQEYYSQFQSTQNISELDRTKQQKEAARQERFEIFAIERKAFDVGKSIGRPVRQRQLIKEFEAKERAENKTFLDKANQVTADLVPFDYLRRASQGNEFIARKSRQLINEFKYSDFKNQQSTLKPTTKGLVFDKTVGRLTDTKINTFAASSGALDFIGNKPVTAAALFAGGAVGGGFVGYLSTGGKVAKGSSLVIKGGLATASTAGVGYRGYQVNKIKDPIEQQKQIGADLVKAGLVVGGFQKGFSALTTAKVDVGVIQKYDTRGVGNRPTPTKYYYKDASGKRVSLLSQVKPASGKIKTSEVISTTLQKPIIKKGQLPQLNIKQTSYDTAYRVVKFPLRKPQATQFTPNVNTVVAKVNYGSSGNLRPTTVTGTSIQSNSFFMRQTIFKSSLKGQGTFTSRTGVNVGGKLKMFQDTGKYFSTKTQPGKFYFKKTGQYGITEGNVGSFSQKSVIYKAKEIKPVQTKDGSFFTKNEVRFNIVDKYYSPRKVAAVSNVKQNINLKFTKKTPEFFRKDGSQIPFSQETTMVTGSSVKKPLNTATRVVIDINTVKTPIAASKRGAVAFKSPVSVKVIKPKKEPFLVKNPATKANPFRGIYKSPFKSSYASAIKTSYNVSLTGLGVENAIRLGREAISGADSDVALSNRFTQPQDVKQFQGRRQNFKRTNILSPATTTTLRNSSSSRTTVPPFLGGGGGVPFTPPPVPVVPLIPFRRQKAKSGKKRTTTLLGRPFKRTRTALQASIADIRNLGGTKSARLSGIGLR